MKRYISLEYLRGFAALTVAISHYLMQVDDRATYEFLSVIAVEIFFPLSGFVLADQIMSLVKAKQGYLIFLIRRWMRTLPPYVIALVAISILLKQDFSGNFFSYLFFVRYLSTGYEASNYFPIAWSLAIEEWYYILFPGFLLIWMRNKSAITSAQALALSVVFFFVFVVFKIAIFQSLDSNFFRIASFLRLDAICAGFIFYLIFYRRNDFLGIVITILATGLIISIFFPMLEAETKVTHDRLMFVLVLPVLFAGIITLLTKLEDCGTLRFQGKGIKLGLWLGRISYSMYLFHIIILYFVSQWPRGGFIMYIATTILFCIIFYQFFEKPIMAARPNYKKLSQ